MIIVFLLGILVAVAVIALLNPDSIVTTFRTISERLVHTQVGEAVPQRAEVQPGQTVTTVRLSESPTLTATPGQSRPPVLRTAPTNTPNPNFTPTPTRTPVPTLVGLQTHMLTLINIERERAGVPRIVLGENIAAQIHAEASLENCISSHWGPDGLKPYMRYSLAGGYQANGENGHGLDYCITAADGFASISNITDEIEDAMVGWMSSPGHRGNILESTHRKINIGIAWDRYNIVAYQHFEGDYIEYNPLPLISEGVLVLKATLKNGAGLLDSDDLIINIDYDPPPHPLTRGQLSRTYCYDNGVLAAILLPPSIGGYSDDEYTTKHSSPCIDPHDIAAAAPAPSSDREALEYWREAKKASESSIATSLTVPYIMAHVWRETSTSFEVEADIGNVLEHHGPGVYTVFVWARIGSDRAPVSQYSLFHGVEPPNTYTR